MPKEYSQLTPDERDRISLLKGQGRSLRSIATELGRSHTTLSRELRRTAEATSNAVYLPHVAQQYAAERRKRACAHPRLRDPQLQAYIREHIQRGWSPERIAGRYKQQGLGQVSHEAIYQWVYDQAKELIKFLPRRHPTRLPRGHRYRKQKVSFIPSRTPIADRPKEIALRDEEGHWEADLVVGRGRKTAIQLVVERKSRFVLIAKLAAFSAAAVEEALASMLEAYPAGLRRSITYDNGRENVRHERVNDRLGTRSYFCDPMQSWQKGSVENAAGLIRRHLPKRTDFAIVSAEEIQRIESWMNDLPRKCLGFKTAAEAFRQSGALRG